MCRQQTVNNAEICYAVRSVWLQPYPGLCEPTGVRARRYQKSPSITFEIRAPDEPRHPQPTYQHSDHYRPRFKTAYGGAPSGNASSGESSYSLRNIIKRRRKTTRRTTPPPPPPPPPPQVLVLPSYRKELMVPDYKFGPYKGHSLMGFTYDAEDVLFAKS